MKSLPYMTVLDLIRAYQAAGTRAELERLYGELVRRDREGLGLDVDDMGTIDEANHVE